jgi:hypothetical protein
LGYFSESHRKKAGTPMVDEREGRERERESEREGRG